MKYPKEYLEEIKTRLKVSTVVSKTVSLKKRGKEFVGLSPFKTEKTPSFTVNDEKGFYHCFSTSEHGNIFDFIMKTQNLRFGEAVKYLANLAGMQAYTFTKKDEERENQWKEYSEIFKTYVDFCHNELLKNNDLIFVKEYLKKRNLTREEVVKFNILIRQNNILLKYRLAYLSDTLVNWCPKLGTVLANDEVKEGLSERGGHPVEQKLMKQWSLRITAYADRLLQGLDKI